MAPNRYPRTDGTGPAPQRGGARPVSKMLRPQKSKTGAVSEAPKRRLIRIAPGGRRGNRYRVGACQGGATAGCQWKKYQAGAAWREVSGRHPPQVPGRCAVPGRSPDFGFLPGTPKPTGTRKGALCHQVRQSALCKQVVKAKPSPAPRAAHPATPCLYHLRGGRRVARARR